MGTGVEAIQWCLGNDSAPADELAKLAKMPDGNLRLNASARALVLTGAQKAKQGHDNEAIEWCQLCQWHNDAAQDDIARDRNQVLDYLKHM